MSGFASRNLTRGTAFVDRSVPDHTIRDHVSIATAGADASGIGSAPASEGVPPSEEIRRKLGWGSAYLPEMPERRNQSLFWRLCDEVRQELDALRLGECFSDGILTAEGAGSVVQIDQCLERLYDCNFGEPEILKGVVVAIQSQTNNAEWTLGVVEFLRDVFAFLRARYVVTSQTIDEVYRIMKEHGLDEYRGAVSDATVKAHYRLVQVNEP